MNVLQKTGAVLAIAGASILCDCSTYSFERLETGIPITRHNPAFLGYALSKKHYCMSVSRACLEQIITEAAYSSEDEEGWYYDLGAQTLYEIGIGESKTSTFMNEGFHRNISSKGGIYIHSHPSFVEDSVEDLLHIELKDLKKRIVEYSRMINSGNCETLQFVNFSRSEAESRLAVIEPYLKKKYFCSTFPSNIDLISSRISQLRSHGASIEYGVGSNTDKKRFVYYSCSAGQDYKSVIDDYLKKVYKYADSIEKNNSGLDETIKLFVADVHSSFGGKIKLHVMTF